MGFKFGGTSFTVGIVTVYIDNVDTDALTAGVRVNVPLQDADITISFHSGRNWHKKRSLDFQIDYTEKLVEEQEESTEYEDIEPEDE